MANVTEMPPPEIAETQESAGESTPERATPAPKPDKPGRGRPPKGSQRPPDVRNPQFFARVAAIPNEDWGTRAFMYVYVDEPVCNAKTWGETRYILKSSKPILDLEPLKQQYGSFKGWMSLNTRATGKDNTDEVDRLNFEIFDPLAPPKIPVAAWANDARNNRWRALLPPEPPPANAAAAGLLDTMKVIKEIKNEVREEMEPAEPQTNSARETLETMKIAKDLFAPSNGTATKDPLDLAMSIATQMNQMKAENPVVDILRDELKDLRAELRESRQNAEKREQALLDELRKKEAAPAATTQKGLLEQVTEFAAVADKLEPIKKLFGFAKGEAETVVTGRKMGTLEFLSDVLPKIFESPLANAAAHKIMQSTVQPQPNPAMQPPPPIERVSQPGGDPFQTFIGQVVTPKMLMFFEAGDSGEDFAGWLYEGFPEYFERLQTFTHPMMPGLVGASAILTAYKNTPNVWPRLATKEPQFTAFVNQFCAWKPDQDDAPADPGVIDAEPEDLDGQIQGGVQ